jgi:hypothetical protein
MHDVLTVVSLLATALLFGGMVLFSFGFAAFVLTALPSDIARPLIRRAFPPYYLLVIGAAAVAAALVALRDPTAAGLLALIAASTVPVRQMLMPAINAASDAGDKRRFGVLHGASVVVQLAQIGLAGWVLARFV